MKMKNRQIKPCSSKKIVNHLNLGLFDKEIDSGSGS